MKAMACNAQIRKNPEHQRDEAMAKVRAQRAAERASGVDAAGPATEVEWAEDMDTWHLDDE